jgi:hypothetical protein
MAREETVWLTKGVEKQLSTTKGALQPLPGCGTGRLLGSRSSGLSTATASYGRSFSDLRFQRGFDYPVRRVNGDHA